jgi:hypothetical protein
MGFKFPFWGVEAYGLASVFPLAISSLGIGVHVSLLWAGDACGLA